MFLFFKFLFYVCWCLPGCTSVYHTCTVPEEARRIQSHRTRVVSCPVHAGNIFSSPRRAARALNGCVLSPPSSSPPPTHTPSTGELLGERAQRRRALAVLPEDRLSSQHPDWQLTIVCNSSCSRRPLLHSTGTALHAHTSKK